MRVRVASIPLAIVALAGCASHGSGAAGGPTSTLTVHVGVFGGPMLPDGKMAASNTPRTGAQIVVTDASGHSRQARTNGDGVATFSVAAGRYTLHAPCEPGLRAVRVRPNHAAHVEVHCDVP
jgi:hypothetical protein